jgi:DNA-binding CsgD family transcriptional regulator
MAQASGWQTRAQRLLERHEDCVEKGYLLLPAALQSLAGGDVETAYELFSRAAETGARFGEMDLLTLGRLGRGRTLVHLGEAAAGVSLLDEAMVAATAGDVSPIVTGIVYCSAIEACQEMFDLGRAREWTAALSHWCTSQPGLLPYRGQCLVYRAEIMQLHGVWQDAFDEAQRACQYLSHPGSRPAVAAAFYQQGEVQRLRGEFAKAEESYRQASRLGREPEPGLALLRLAQGRVDAAAAAIRRAVDEAGDRLARSRLLGASVEIMLAAGDLQAARSAADELALLARDSGAAYLQAVAAHAAGEVLIALGDPRAALVSLRRAWAAWQEIEVPYEAARVRVLIGRCCRALGDEDTADMEFDAARWVFEELGARPALARLESLSGSPTVAGTGGLTAREIEVLRLVAAGKTNRAIAAELFLSEKTVARHVSNIFIKLDLSSRSAATAYAYEHDLL